MMPPDISAGDAADGAAAEHEPAHASEVGEDALSALVNRLMEEGGVESGSESENEAGEEEQEEVSVEDSPLIDAARNVEKGLKSKE